MLGDRPVSHHCGLLYDIMAVLSDILTVLNFYLNNDAPVSIVIKFIILQLLVQS